MASEDTNSIHSPGSHTEDSTTPPMTPTISPRITKTAMLPNVTSEETSSLLPKQSATTITNTTTTTTTTADSNGTTKTTKRRAARACVSCRARKVRCDVVEGAPCGNCRWDGVECVVQESRRRKKSLYNTNPTASYIASAPHDRYAEAHLLKAKTTPNPIAIASGQQQQHPLPPPPQSQPIPAAAAAAAVPASITPSSHNSAALSHPDANQNQSRLGRNDGVEGHAPYLTSQRPSLIPSLPLNHQGSRYPSIFPQPPPTGHNGPHPDPSTGAAAGGANGREIVNSLLRTAQFRKPTDETDVFSPNCRFLRPLPPKIAPEDVAYLRAKGALSVPGSSLQRLLLRAYAEYVHPYMPLLDLHEFLSIADARDGSRGQTSLFLYQAVMFCATAFVSNAALKEAGYFSRKAARRTFFTKARLLYDFDYENDRLLLVQGLLLMTYWYETPDDQKDTWHWMGVAISLGHTIGLHRNPANTNMPPPRRKLWKRIWWSCFMRDRLIALGMRRPTRIKDEDFDVPMLAEEDFDIRALPDDVQVVGPECTLLRDVTMQQELAQMCIAKAKLSLCISQMLKAQYSVLIRAQTHPENMTNSTMMLLPNKQLDNMESVAKCDHGLAEWAESLPEACQYRPLSSLDIRGGRGVMALQRNLLHMVYFTTVSALHRPLFLPSSPAGQILQQTTPGHVQQQISRIRVCNSAAQITRMAAELHALRLERFLPTTGVTVVLPAMIIHMIEMKNPSPAVQVAAHRGFQQCMRVMERLRDTYAAADYAVAFVNAAMRKGAQADQTPPPPQQQQQQQRHQSQAIFEDGNNAEIANLGQQQLKATTTTTVGTNTASQPYVVTSGSYGVENTTTPPPEPQLFSMAPEDHPLLLSDPTLSSDVTQSYAPSFHTTTTATAINDYAHLNMVGRGTPGPMTGITLGAHSPPSTDVMTPTSSGMSAGSPSSTDRRFDMSIGGGGQMDLDLDLEAPFEDGGFDWNAISGSHIDFDQWLQFPPGEGAPVGPNMGLNMRDNGLVALSQVEGSDSSFTVATVSEDVIMA